MPGAVTSPFSLPPKRFRTPRGLYKHSGPALGCLRPWTCLSPACGFVRSDPSLRSRVGTLSAAAPACVLRLRSADVARPWLLAIPVLLTRTVGPSVQAFTEQWPAGLSETLSQTSPAAAVTRAAHWFPFPPEAEVRLCRQDGTLGSSARTPPSMDVSPGPTDRHPRCLPPSQQLDLMPTREASPGRGPCLRPGAITEVVMGEFTGPSGFLLRNGHFRAPLGTPLLPASLPPPGLSSPNSNPNPGIRGALRTPSVDPGIPDSSKYRPLTAGHWGAVSTECRAPRIWV